VETINTRAYRFVGCFIVAVLFAACSASDTTRSNAGEAHHQADSLAVRRSSTRLTTDQDTVVASVMTQPKAAEQLGAPADTAGGMAFTVQIGAFAEPKNALRAQRLAKELFEAYPVFNHFEPSLKLYRVSIGKFGNREEAVEFLKAVINVLPKEYSSCWVNTIFK
jgi:cell division septation protein DedD